MKVSTKKGEENPLIGTILHVVGTGECPSSSRSGWDRTEIRRPTSASTHGPKGKTKDAEVGLRTAGAADEIRPLTAPQFSKVDARIRQMDIDQLRRWFGRPRDCRRSSTGEHHDAQHQGPPSVFFDLDIIPRSLVRSVSDLPEKVVN